MDAAWRRSGLVTALLATAAFAPAMAQQANPPTDNPLDLGTLNGGTSKANAVSADGTTVVGLSDNQAFRFVWGSGGMVALPSLYGGAAEATGVNANGTVVVGGVIDNGNSERAFRWTSATGTMQDLDPNRNFFRSRATAVNPDGTVVVGQAMTDTYKAFRWDATFGMVDLGRLPGTRASYATAVNNDGNIVVGSSDDGPAHTNSRAFLWSMQTGNMIDLGTLNGGANAAATGVSGDGTIVVGYANDGSAGGAERAFRWTAASNTMTSLGILSGGSVSRAYAISRDGTVVVGIGDVDGVNQVTRAFRWSQTDNRMITVEDWLRENGAAVGSNITKAAYGVSADGNVVVGELQNSHAFIARGPVQVQTGAAGATATAATTTTAGLMDVQNFQTSLATAPRLAPELQNTSLAVDSTRCSPLFMSLDAGQSSASFTGGAGAGSAKSTNGGFGMGQLGYAHALEDGWIVCLSGGGQYARMDTLNGGNAVYGSGYIAPEVSHSFDNRLVAALSGYFSWGKADIRRGYLNGTANDSSFGSSATQTTGFSARLAWQDALSAGTTSVSPFASYTFLSARMDGYSETGGSFPVRFDGSRENSNAVRIGADARTPINDLFAFVTHLEYGHRFEKAGPGIRGQILGLSAFSIDGAAVQQDWLSGGIGVAYKLGDGDGLLMVNTSNQTGRNTTWLSASYRVKF
ncbi:putative HAF family extracellular repeat protein [Rhizobium aquaticum]|uniref:HAF family extracellular repeat protein n=1 Tax=Rhizobium aquaticum TaxID=1549636 RepID=A0ABV2J553_9HYPH